MPDKEDDDYYVPHQKKSVRKVRRERLTAGMYEWAQPMNQSVKLLDLVLFLYSNTYTTEVTAKKEPEKLLDLGVLRAEWRRGVYQEDKNRFTKDYLSNFKSAFKLRQPLFATLLDLALDTSPHFKDLADAMFPFMTGERSYLDLSLEDIPWAAVDEEEYGLVSGLVWAFKVKELQAKLLPALEKIGERSGPSYLRDVTAAIKDEPHDKTVLLYDVGETSATLPIRWDGHINPKPGQGTAVTGSFYAATVAVGLQQEKKTFFKGVLVPRKEVLALLDSCQRLHGEDKELCHYLDEWNVRLFFEVACGTLMGGNPPGQCSKYELLSFGVLIQQEDARANNASKKNDPVGLDI